jgi:hypothetical protein
MDTHTRTFESLGGIQPLWQITTLHHFFEGRVRTALGVKILRITRCGLRDRQKTQHPSRDSPEKRNIPGSRGEPSRCGASCGIGHFCGIGNFHQTEQAGKSSKSCRDLAKFGDFGGKFIQRECSDPGRFAKITFGGGFSANGLSCRSGEEQKRTTTVPKIEVKHSKRCGAFASHRSPKGRQGVECGGRAQRRHRFGFFAKPRWRG